eukprot:14791411-Heterocapsa_arctica.AAC.1
MGEGKGADTAAWVGAVEAEVAAAQGKTSVGAFIDSEKCYDNIPISKLVADGTQHEGIGRLVTLAVHQYTGPRRVRWASATGHAVWPNHGIPAGCPLANGLLHVYLMPAMVS